MISSYKKSNSVLAGITLIACTFLFGCNTPSQKVEVAKENVIEAQEDLNKAREDYAAEVLKYKQESSERLTASELALEDIKANMAKSKKEIKAEYKKQVEVLEQKISTLKAKMNDYTEGGKEKWESFKIEFNRDMDELGQSLKDFSVDNKK